MKGFDPLPFPGAQGADPPASNNTRVDTELVEAEALQSNRDPPVQIHLIEGGPGGAGEWVIRDSRLVILPGLLYSARLVILPIIVVRLLSL
jgi:hypothetical protein